MSEIRVFGTANAETTPAPADGLVAEQWRSAGHSVPSLRVEVPHETLASSLTRMLQPLSVKTVPGDGYSGVGVELRERNPEQRVVKALSSIDDWLASSGLSSVRIHVDGCTHTLHVLSPRAPGVDGAPRPPKAA